MQAHHTKDLESSSLPTPRASEPGSTSAGYGDSLSDFANRVIYGYARKDLELFGTLTTATSGRSPEFRKNANPNPVEFVEDLLRTPTASQGQGGAIGEDEARRRGNTVGIRDQAMDLAKMQGHKVSREQDNLLPTPQGDDSKNTGHNENRRKTLASATYQKTNWGRFDAAITRWEQTIERTAPPPTRPDGKDNAHRLSPEFIEWMMGLPKGWITECELTRNEELKLAGNGVVPQQAELALRILLEGVSFEPAPQQVNLPTPTVSDTFTDNLRSTQQKPGSMHSVTLPQAVKMIREN